jgi:hypothetical protein
MLLGHQHGYSVRSRDLNGISFESESLSDCYRFCHNGDVIVELNPVKCGFSLIVRYSDWNAGLSYDKYAHCLRLWKLHIQVIPEFKHKVGKIVYDSLQDEKKK